MHSEALVELAKRRGFFFQSSEVYGGVAGFFTYGPRGAAVKRNVESSWRDRFTVAEGNLEVDAPIIMPEAVFEASGHLETFTDMLVECAECGETHRADHVVEDATDVTDAEAMSLEGVGELIAEHGLTCPSCGAALAGEPVEEFNLMFGTNIGPGSSQPGYLRPETAQGIFVEFNRLKEYARNQLPFGVTQIGRAYRNEISPRNALVRVREFTQAELELFHDPERDRPDLSKVADVEVTLAPAEGDTVETTIGDAVDDDIIGDEWIAYYMGIAREWYEQIGVDLDRFRFRQHLPGELSHYSSDCWDAESEIDGDWIEIAGFADRGTYDLSRHAGHSGEEFTVFQPYDEPIEVERATVDPDMSYLGPEYGGAAADIRSALETLAETDRSAFDGDVVTVDVDGETYEIPVEMTGFSVDVETVSGEHITPRVIEPSIGIGRTVYTVLMHALSRDEVNGEERTFLSLPPAVAPTFVGVFPLQTDDDLESLASDLAGDLRQAGFAVTYDDAGNIGRRYRRQDEVGTPFCVTVDYESLDDDAVTLRERDSTAQVRVAIDDLVETLSALRRGDRTFSDL